MESKGETRGMHLRVHVVAGGREIAFEMPVGKGEQNVRWLGLAASQRYSRQLQAKGRGRQREEALSQGGQFIPGGVFVQGVYEPIDPFTKLNEILETGSSVQVVLQDEIGVRSDGSPSFPEWSSKAFKHSEEGKHQTEVYIKRDANESRTENSAQRALSADKKVEGAIQFTLDTNPETMASTLEHDWHEMHIHELFKGQKQLLMEIKSIFLSSFIDIVVVLDHFSTCAGLSSLTYIEAIHYIHHCGILNLKVDNSYDLTLFNQCAMNATRHNPNTLPLPLITRPQLLEIFVRLLCKRYKAAAVPLELKKILKERVAAAAEALRVPISPVRSALKQSQDLKALVNQHKATLTELFDRYAMTAQDQQMPSFLTLPELHLILRDTNLVPGFDEVAKYHCTKDLFGVCQWLSESDSSHKIEPLQSITFNEFVEVILLTMAEANSLYSVDFVQGFQEAMNQFGKLCAEERE